MGTRWTPPICRIPKRKWAFAYDSLKRNLLLIECPRCCESSLTGGMHVVLEREWHQEGVDALPTSLGRIQPEMTCPACGLRFVGALVAWERWPHEYENEAIRKQMDDGRVIVDFPYVD